MTDTLVLVISDRKKDWGESDLLNIGQDFALSDCKDVWHEFNQKLFKFALIDQDKWSNYKEKFKEIVEKYKHVIVWSHKAGGWPCTDVEKHLGKTGVCDDFSHIDNKKELMELMKCIGNLKSKKADCKDCNDKFNALVRKTKKKESEIWKSSILKLFLPLDIEMQTLTCLQKQNKTDKINDFLVKETSQGSTEPSGMLRTISDYEVKLKEIKKIDEIEELKENKTLRRLLNMDEGNTEIVEFFTRLNEAKTKIQNNEEPSYEGIIKYFSNLNWQVDGADPETIKSFHDWYCAVASCLSVVKS